MGKIIYHIDVNSAFLSWTAAYKVKVLGEALDLRTILSHSSDSLILTTLNFILMMIPFLYGFSNT